MTCANNANFDLRFYKLTSWPSPIFVYFLLQRWGQGGDLLQLKTSMGVAWLVEAPSIRGFGEGRNRKLLHVTNPVFPILILF